MLRLEPLAPPQPAAPRDFLDVLTSRRSAVGGKIDRDAVGSLLHCVTSAAGEPTVGRAGMLTRRRSVPSAGGLHPFHLICIDDAGVAAHWYDPYSHAFGVLDVDSVLIGAQNASSVTAILGQNIGCTIRFIADFSKIAAAYDEPLSLVWREAGCLLATLCLAAEWAGLCACPLGFVGQELVGPLGFPEPRFLATGGVQIASRTLPAP